LTTRLWLPALAAGIALATPAHASDKGWARGSDVGEAALAAAALGIPVARHDWKGALQTTGAMGAAELIALSLKQTIHETRPDGSDRKSFPSGHASLSFAAAASLHQRYGWQAGLPATLVAAFVGVARVEADKHYWHDVVAGAVIGEAAGFLIVHPHDERVRIVPWGDAHSGGVSLGMRF